MWEVDGLGGWVETEYFWKVGNWRNKMWSHVSSCRMWALSKIANIKFSPPPTQLPDQSAEQHHLFMFLAYCLSLSLLSESICSLSNQMLWIWIKYKYEHLQAENTCPLQVPLPTLCKAIQLVVEPLGGPLDPLSGCGTDCWNQMWPRLPHRISIQVAIGWLPLVEGEICRNGNCLCATS